MKKSSFIIEILLVFSCLLSTIHVSFGDDQNDNFFRHAIQRYISLSHSPRSMGMGGVWTTLTHDNEGITGNPATLADTDRVLIRMGYAFEQISGSEIANPGNSIEEDLHSGILNLSFPIPGRTTIGIAGDYTGSETDDTIDTDNESWDVSLALSKRLNERFAIGYGVSFLDDSEKSLWANYDLDFGHLHRLGVLVTPNETINLGLVGIAGFGDTDSDSIIRPSAISNGENETLGLRGGISYQINDPLLLVFDIGYLHLDRDAEVRFGGSVISADEEGDVFDVGMGGEYQFNEFFTGRLGIRYQHIDYESDSIPFSMSELDYVAPTTGFGLQITKTFRLM